MEHGAMCEEGDVRVEEEVGVFGNGEGEHDWCC